jgi:hypothetical protein
MMAGIGLWNCVRMSIGPSRSPSRTWIIPAPRRGILRQNGICERFHKTMLNEFYRVAFRKKIYRTLEELQVDLDGWIEEYNEQRPHEGRWLLGEDTDADVYRQCAVGKGENPGGLIR